MRQKMIRDRRKSSKSVEASVVTHGSDVAIDLGEALANHLEEGEQLPDFLTTLRLFQRLLAESRHRLTAVAARHLEALDADIEKRRRRDDLTRRLGSKVSRIREALSGLFGRDGSTELAGLLGRTAQEPEALLAQSEVIVNRFGDPDLEVGPPELSGFQMEPGAVVDELEPDVVALRSVIADLNRGDRRSDATLVDKRRAIESHDRLFGAVATVLRATYTLAGHLELARRVRPSSRRPGRTEEDVEAEESTSGSDVENETDDA